MAELEIKKLREENEHLNRELGEAISERNQSAKYGLALVQEKTKLEVQVNELESLYETAKHELKIAQEALVKFQQSQEFTTRTGIEQEEKLLIETTALETSLNTQIFDLENELQKIRQELKICHCENQRLQNEVIDRQGDIRNCEEECRLLRNENRELKVHETKLYVDYAELEDENITLQKQIANLKTNQVEYEGFKHELISLREHILFLESVVDETNKLKIMAVNEMKDTLKAYQVERENKQALKKQLDTYLNRESMYNIKDLALKFQENEDQEDEYADKSDETGIGSEGSIVSNEQSNQKHIDLYTEFQLMELKKVEMNLESAEKEKQRLCGELDLVTEKLKHLEEIHDSVVSYCKEIEYHVKSDEQVSKEKLRKLVNSWNWEAIDPELRSQQLMQLNEEISRLTNTNQDLLADYEFLNDFVLKVTNVLESSQNETLVINDELAQLYQMISSVPKYQSLDQTLFDTNKPIDKKNDDEIVNSNDLKTDTISLKNLKCLNEISLDLRNKVQVISEKTKYLNGAFENIKINNPSIEQGTIEATSNETMLELQELVIRLKSLLITKKEQIAAMRTVLKSNKNSAETALNNLKNKYAKEHAVVTETMSVLRNELRSLKQESVTFIRTREMYAARCQEYANRIEALTVEFNVVDAERKTLNQLLKLAVQQKLILTQRLEECEMRELEVRNMRRKHI